MLRTLTLMLCGYGCAMVLAVRPNLDSVTSGASATPALEKAQNVVKETSTLDGLRTGSNGRRQRLERMSSDFARTGSFRLGVDSNRQWLPTSLAWGAVIWGTPAIFVLAVLAAHLLWSRPEMQKEHVQGPISSELGLERHPDFIVWRSTDVPPMGRRAAVAMGAITSKLQWIKMTVFAKVGRSNQEPEGSLCFLDVSAFEAAAMQELPVFDWRVLPKVQQSVSLEMSGTSK